jgi:hypothetical protein
MPPPGEVNTCRDVAQWYEQSFVQRLPLLEALSGEDLKTPVDFIGLRNDPAVAYMNIAIRPSVHHRGQISTYISAPWRKSTRHPCGKLRRALSTGCWVCCRRKWAEASRVLIFIAR